MAKLRVPDDRGVTNIDDLQDAIAGHRPQVGMTPMEAIVANASGNAAMVNLAGEVGVIAPGKLADIVIWDNDPIADITVLASARSTVVTGSQ